MRILAVILLLAGFAPQALACGCSKANTVRDAEAMNPPYIFTGEVKKVVTSKFDWGTRQTVTFRVLQLFRGEPTRFVTVDFDAGGTSCDLEPLGFRRADRYMISAEYVVVAATQEKRLNGDFCHLREKLLPRS